MKEHLEDHCTCGHGQSCHLSFAAGGCDEYVDDIGRTCLCKEYRPMDQPTFMGEFTNMMDMLSRFKTELNELKAHQVADRSESLENAKHIGKQTTILEHQATTIDRHTAVIKTLEIRPYHHHSDEADANGHAIKELRSEHGNMIKRMERLEEKDVGRDLIGAGVTPKTPPDGISCNCLWLTSGKDVYKRYDYPAAGGCKVHP